MAWQVKTSQGSDIGPSDEGSIPTDRFSLDGTLVPDSPKTRFHYDTIRGRSWQPNTQSSHRIESGVEVADEPAATSVQELQPNDVTELFQLHRRANTRERGRYRDRQAVIPNRPCDHPIRTHT